MFAKAKYKLLNSVFKNIDTNKEVAVRYESIERTKKNTKYSYC